LRDRSDKDGSKAILCETNIMACIKCRNPTEQGCRAEEIAVTAISRGDCALFRCIIQDPPRTITTTHFDTTDDVTQPVGQSLRRPLRAACFQLRAHRLFAEGAHIRERQDDKEKSKVVAADVYAFQYTRQTVAAHSGSLDFLTGDHEQWVSDLVEIPIRWHFVWVLTSTECSKRLKEGPNVRGHGFSRRKGSGAPAYTEWFFAFSDIVPNLTLQ
jgi:hypothetical protein